MAAKADGCNARAIEDAVSVRQSGFNNFFIKTLDINLIMLVCFYMRKFRELHIKVRCVLQNF